MRVNEHATRRRRLRRWAVLAVKLALLAAVVGYVGVALFDAIGEADFSKLTFRPAWILGGAALIVAGVLAGAMVFQKFYGRMGSPLTLPQGVSLLTVPMLGGYLPGRVFSVAGHAAIARVMGVPLEVSAAGVFLLTGLGLLAAILVGLVLLLAAPVPGLDPGLFRLSLAGALVLTLLVLHPRLYLALVNLLLRAMRRPPVRMGLRLASMLLMLGGMCLYVIGFVGGFVVMARGVMELPFSAAPTMIGAISLATTIGFLALFAPAGIGVREGLLLLLLSPVLGRPTAAVLAVTLRLLQIVVDVLLVGSGALILRRLRRGPAGPR